ncbi:MAG: hypothetical protein PF517_21595 [Salinivirgaceae bacterium]|jgi:hypothetical protein|nr:hypothetical protein [Salinivirgaceae bacterium]
MQKIKLFTITLFVSLWSCGQCQDFGKADNFSKGLGAADYSFDIGTEVGTALNDSYYFSNYFSPSAKFDITKKFSIIAGVGARYTQLNNYPMFNNEYYLEKTNATLTSFFTYASGIYKLSNKVNVNATVLVDENILNIPDAPMALQKQYKDVSLGVNYNVTRNFSINAQMHISDRPYNRNFNSHTNFGLNSPFGYSPLF